MDGGLWRPEDPAWMAERKALWMQVKANLDVMSMRYSPFKRKFHKYHKELFFFGRLNPEAAIEPGVGSASESFFATGGGAFASLLPVFMIWYHPQPEVLDFDGLRQGLMRYTRLDNCRRVFFSELAKGALPGGAPYPPKCFPADYGMMGGREALGVRLLVPGLDPREVLPHPDPSVKEPAGWWPYDVSIHCWFDTWYELYRDARFVPSAPGQFLWDNLSHAVEHYPEEAFHRRAGSSEWHRRRWLELIAEILRFEDRTDRSRRRPTTIALVERLIGKYERKEFTPAMLALWDEAKRRIKELETFETVEYSPTPERIDRHFGGFPVELQEARIAQWKQV